MIFSTTYELELVSKLEIFHDFLRLSPKNFIINMLLHYNERITLIKISSFFQGIDKNLIKLSFFMADGEYLKNIKN